MHPTVCGIAECQEPFTCKADRFTPVPAEPSLKTFQCLISVKGRGGSFSNEFLFTGVTYVQPLHGVSFCKGRRQDGLLEWSSHSGKHEACYANQVSKVR